MLLIMNMIESWKSIHLIKFMKDGDKKKKLKYSNQ